MKIILEAEGVKRELSGPFNIALSRVDLSALRTQLNRIDSEWEAAGCSYGWASVYPQATGPGPNTPPMPWAQR